MIAIDGIGPTIAAAWMEWRSIAENRAPLEKFCAGGVRFEDPEFTETAVSEVLAGLTLLVSGTLAGFSRDEAHQAITRRGGRATGSVSKSTSALVVGDSPGASKIARAEALGIPVIDGAAFVELLERGPEALG